LWNWKCQVQPPVTYNILVMDLTVIISTKAKIFPPVLTEINTQDDTKEVLSYMQ
jgi:hypothetical protein